MKYIQRRDIKHWFVLLSKRLCFLFIDWIQLSQVREPLPRDILIFGSKFLDIPGTHFIDFRKIKNWLNLEAIDSCGIPLHKMSILVTIYAYTTGVYLK